MQQIDIKKDDIIELKIESIGMKGDGVGNVKGLIIMVPKTEIDKTYEVRITGVYQKYAFGIALQEVQENGF